jgi:hypothetical protein
MYGQSASRNEVAGSSMTSSFEADNAADAALAACVRDARQSKRFAHEENVSSLNVRRWPGASEARHELRSTLEWLKALLSGTGEEVAVRRRVVQLADIADHVGGWCDGDLVELLGPIKRNLQKLCERLHEDPRPSTVAAACRELRPLCAPLADRHGMPKVARAIESAVLAVEKESRPAVRRADASAQATRPVPTSMLTWLARLTTRLAVPSLRASTAKKVPKSDDVALNQALKDMGAEGVRACYAQLGAAFDRLVTLMPPGTNPLLKNGVIAWRDSYAAPAKGFGRADAEMLFGGRLMLTALCNKLDELELELRRQAFQSLEVLMPQEYVHPKARSCSFGSHVSMLANVLIGVESASEIDNPHLEERRSSFEALVAPLLKREQLTADEVDKGMFELGLAPDCSVHGAHSKMHPVYNNAVWQVCLESVLGPIEPHPLADVRKAERLLARR